MAEHAWRGPLRLQPLLITKYGVKSGKDTDHRLRAPGIYKSLPCAAQELIISLALVNQRPRIPVDRSNISQVCSDAVRSLNGLQEVRPRDKLLSISVYQQPCLTIGECCR